MMLPQLSHAASSSPSSTAAVQSTPGFSTIVVNGKKLSILYPIVNGSTMVPIYVITEDIGAKVTWNNVEKKATVIKDNVTIQLVLNKSTATVNNKSVKLDNPPIIIGDRMLVPIKFVATNFGYNVGWIPSTRTAILTPESFATPTPTAKPTPTPTAKPTPTPTAKPTPTPTAKPTPTPTATPTPT
ncbi:copper amine oxidase N-terminal domain-containing protein, partial [Gorillibacterium massiliense]|uniref:copper amine oxidase N-terminal domain-containing protein n=1 Tax=Gorillibacterium massiliense TaxID=1280390 RepID=UPI001EE1B343